MSRHGRGVYERAGMEQRVFLARLTRGGWGVLFDEMRERGWRAVKLDPRTGARVPTGEKRGVWVFRYVGHGSDEPVRYARRQAGQRVIVQERALKPGER